MTYEGAIKILTELKPIPVDGFKIIAEAYDLAIDALEMRMPKKIVKGKDLFWEYQCPNTNCDTQFARHASYAFCPGCGQALDWSVDE